MMYFPTDEQWLLGMLLTIALPAVLLVPHQFGPQPWLTRKESVMQAREKSQIKNRLYPEWTDRSIRMKKGSAQLMGSAVIQRFPGFAAVIHHLPDRLRFRFVRLARKSQENHAEKIKDMFQ
jgi:hypothetical protein